MAHSEFAITPFNSDLVETINVKSTAFCIPVITISSRISIKPVVENGSSLIGINDDSL